MNKPNRNSNPDLEQIENEEFLETQSNADQSLDSAVFSAFNA